MAMQRFPTTEAELAELIRACRTVHCALGSGDLLWDDTQPLPEAVLKLGEMRGVYPPAQTCNDLTPGD